MKGFAPVAPIWLLQKLGKEAGRYHLPLAHDVVRYAEDYKMFFGNLKKEFGPLRTVILDNSVIELRESCTPDLLLQACDICDPTHLVLPDVLEDCNGTLQKSIEGYQELWQSLMAKNIKIAVVPQGSSLREWVRCAETLAEQIPLSLWCVPRNFEHRLGSRWDACEILKTIHSAPIHLIGFSDWVYRDMYAATHHKVIGIDSAVPIRLGQEGRVVTLHADAGKRGDWWERTSQSTILDPQVESNLRRVLRWLNP